MIKGKGKNMFTVLGGCDSDSDDGTNPNVANKKKVAEKPVQEVNQNEQSIFAKPSKKKNKKEKGGKQQSPLKPKKNANGDVKEEVEEKVEVKVEEKVEVKVEEKLEVKVEEKVEEKVAVKVEELVQDNKLEIVEEKQQENTDQLQKLSIEEKPALTQQNPQQQPASEFYKAPSTQTTIGKNLGITRKPRTETQPNPNYLGKKEGGLVKGGERRDPKMTYWTNEKEDFFVYLEYLLYEDTSMSYKEVAWLRREFYKFMNLKTPEINSETQQPPSLYFKKNLEFAFDSNVYPTSVKAAFDNVLGKGKKVFFTGFVTTVVDKPNCYKEMFYGRLFLRGECEVTIYEGFFKDSQITGSGVKIYNQKGEVLFEGPVNYVDEDDAQA